MAGRDAAAFAGLVPFRYRERLAAGLLGEDLLLVAASALGIPFGAALARLTRDAAVVESVAVARSWRRQGVGRALLAALDREVAALPVSALFVRDTAAGGAVARILDGLGWSAPRPAFSQFEVDRRLLAAPLLARPDPQGVELVPFAALPEDDRPAVATDGAPLLEGSFVARVGGEQVGWLATDRIGPATARWTALRVDEARRGGRIGSALFVRGLRATLELPGIERGVALAGSTTGRCSGSSARGSGRTWRRPGRSGGASDRLPARGGRRKRRRPSGRVGGANVTGSRKEPPLVEVWLDQSAHPLLALALSIAFEAGALGGLVYWAGWRGIVHAIGLGNAHWFVLCLGGQVAAYLGYSIALRGIAAVDDGVRLDLPLSFAIVSIGFAPVFCANTSGGFSIDLVALREAGMPERKALVRVLSLSALEYAVLAPAVAACGVLLVLHLGGYASPELALPWLAVVPGAVLAGWLSSPSRPARWSDPSRRGRLGRGFAHAVAALAVLRRLLLERPHNAAAFAGAGLYWLGDLVTFWAALRVFEVRLSLPALVLAYGTGWALTRRSLPLGGPGVVEVLLAWVLTWFHVPFSAAAAGVVAYRIFNFWIALLPAAAVLPFAHRLHRRLRALRP